MEESRLLELFWSGCCSTADCHVPLYIFRLALSGVQEDRTATPSNPIHKHNSNCFFCMKQNGCKERREKDDEEKW